LIHLTISKFIKVILFWCLRGTGLKAIKEAPKGRWIGGRGILTVNVVLSSFSTFPTCLAIHSFSDSHGFPNVRVRQEILEMGEASGVHPFGQKDNEHGILLPGSLRVYDIRLISHIVRHNVLEYSRSEPSSGDWLLLVPAKAEAWWWGRL
jgi:hypothetical protein